MSIHPQAQLIVPQIKHELDVFGYLTTRINSEWKDADPTTRNLLLESLLLHARVLRDFFVCDPRRDDVSARHFFDDPSMWEEIANNLCPYLRQNKKRMDKMLSPLTYSRLNEPKKWEMSTISNELIQAWQKFSSALSPEQQGWFS